MLGARKTKRYFLHGALGALLVLLGASTASTGPLSLNSWRPYTNRTALVTLGMTKAEVLIKAGKPTSKDLVSHGTKGRLNITVWTYVRAGRDAAITTLTFNGNRLGKIATTLVQP